MDQARDSSRLTDGDGQIEECAGEREAGAIVFGPELQRVATGSRSDRRHDVSCWRLAVRHGTEHLAISYQR